MRRGSQSTGDERFEVRFRLVISKQVLLFLIILDLVVEALDSEWYDYCHRKS